MFATKTDITMPGKMVNMTPTESNGLRLGGARPLTVSDDLRRANAGAVLRTVLMDGPLARAQIAEKLGVTRATVTRVADQLLAAGLLREGEPLRTSPGRPMVPLELGDVGRLAITVQIGATEMRVGTVDLRGEVISEDRYRYSDPTPQGVAGLIQAGVHHTISELPQGKWPLGISASIGGWVDPTGETIVEYTPLGWKNVPLVSLLPDIGLPRYFDQLVRGLALAESMFGVARAAPDFLEIWTGNVLGAALVVDGEVRRGPRGGAGGIDHMPTRLRGQACSCGAHNCLGTVMTDRAILEDAVIKRILPPDATSRSVIEAIESGNQEARELLQERAVELARACATLVDFAGPGLLVVAGLATTAPGYRAAFEEEFHSASGQASTTRVEMSRFGDLAPTVASAALLLDAFVRDPLAFDTDRPMGGLH